MTTISDKYLRICCHVFEQHVIVTRLYILHHIPLSMTFLSTLCLSSPLTPGHPYSLYHLLKPLQLCFPLFKCPCSSPAALLPRYLSTQYPSHFAPFPQILVTQFLSRHFLRYSPQTSTNIQPAFPPILLFSPHSGGSLSLSRTSIISKYLNARPAAV